MARDLSAPTLSFWSLLALGVNGIVGVGIFFAPRDVARLVPGPAGLWVYALTALSLLPIAAVYAALGSRFAEDGGPFVWAKAAFGNWAGFLVGWIASVSAVLSTSAVVSGLATHAAPLFGVSAPLMRSVFGASLALVLAVVAASGLRPSAWVWSGLTLLKLAPLVALVLAFLFSSVPAAVPAPVAAPDTASALPRAMLIVVFALQGFEIVVVPAGSSPGTGRGVAAATLLSLVFVTALYVALHAACLAVPALGEQGAPLVAAAAAHGGGTLQAAVGVATNISALGIAFGMFAMTPRYLATLGTSQGLGDWLGWQSPKRVPTRALWLTTAVVMLLVFGPDLEQLFVLSSVAVVLQYTVSAAALVLLATKRVRGLSRRHLLLGPCALVPVALVASAASRAELLATGGAVVLGAAIWQIRRHFA